MIGITPDMMDPEVNHVLEHVIEVVAAGAVITTVGMFLRFLSQQQGVWREESRHIHDKSNEAIERNTAAFDRLNETIQYCKTKNEGK